MRSSFAFLCAALALPAVPAAAEADFGVAALDQSPVNVRVHRGGDDPRWRDGRHDRWRGDGRRDGRRDRRRGDGRDIYVQDYYGGAWAYYNNRSWESDSYNDWWHDQPHRSMPRWVQRNGDCQRQWWSGGGWTC